MPEPPQRTHAVPGPLPTGDRRAGEEALHFTRWFLSSRYRLMGQFLDEITAEADPELTRARFLRALKHGERVLKARLVVNVLLAVGAIAAASSAVATVLSAAPFLDALVAFSASATVALVAVRLALDRYLERVDVTATFLALQLRPR